jgi:hypothetical protein
LYLLIAFTFASEYHTFSTVSRAVRLNTCVCSSIVFYLSPKQITSCFDNPW